MPSAQPDNYACCKIGNNQIATLKKKKKKNPTFSELNSICVMQIKTEITDLFWKNWIKLYIAENLPFTLDT